MKKQILHIILGALLALLPSLAMGAVSKVSPQRKEEVRGSCIFRCLFLELNSCISV